MKWQRDPQRDKLPTNCHSNTDLDGMKRRLVQAQQDMHRSTQETQAKQWILEYSKVLSTAARHRYSISLKYPTEDLKVSERLS
jgi:hypothetical protein